MWPQFRDIKKLTTKKEVDRVYGKPHVQIGDLPVYYYGNGFLIGYVNNRYKVQRGKNFKNRSKEEFAHTIYHFGNTQFLPLHFGVDNIKLDDAEKFEGNIINQFATYNSTFIEILNWTNAGFHNVYTTSGETRRLINGKVERINIFITYGQYTLYFYEKEINSKVSGFEFVLSE